MAPKKKTINFGPQKSILFHLHEVYSLYERSYASWKNNECDSNTLWHK